MHDDDVTPSEQPDAPRPRRSWRSLGHILIPSEVAEEALELLARGLVQRPPIVAIFAHQARLEQSLKRPHADPN